MYAIAISDFGGPDVLEVRDIPIPEPRLGQLRVRVRASTVAKIDISTRNGAISRGGLLAPHEDIGLGWDVAGTADPPAPRGRGRAVRGGPDRGRAPAVLLSPG